MQYYLFAALNDIRNSGVWNNEKVPGQSRKSVRDGIALLQLPVETRQYNISVGVGHMSIRLNI